MKIPFVAFGDEYRTIKPEIDAAIERVLQGGDLILRRDLEEFEQNFARYVGSKYCVGLNSGTDALYLSLWSLGISSGDEVLVPSHTFVATAQVVVQLGATPVLYDTDGDLTLSEKTKVIIPAHIAGELSGDMYELLNIANANRCLVIEDACQALGAIQHGQKAGTFGIAGCFSFYPAKLLGAYGDAGAVVTDNEYMAQEIRELRNHYKKDYSRWGINSRLDNIQAAVLNVKLKHLPQALDRRKQIAEQYLSCIHSGTLPKNTEGRVWQDFIFLHPERDRLFSYLKEKEIETMKNEYPFPIGKGPLALAYEAATLRLPCHPTMTDEQVHYVIETINAFK